jgi:hypothetical protein
MDTSIWTPPATKLRFYEALYDLNRSFEATIQVLERLESLKFFRADYLDALKTRLEYSRAQANEELIDTLQGYEQADSARLDEAQRKWEKRQQDPNDVLLVADERRREIKEQIRNLRQGLQQQRPRSKKRRQ